MILFNYEFTLCRDFYTRVQPRPWFRIEKQEHAEEWEILMGSTLLLVTARTSGTKQDTRCTA
jgi:hypothetical protein